MGTNTIESQDDRKKIILFDTTLRDGHQCPGAAVEEDQRYFDIVRGIDGLGIDIGEVGFPASSEHEAWRVSEVAKMAQSGEISMMVCGLTQMVDFQVEACLRALEPAIKNNKAFFHIYFPVDPNLRAASIGEKVSDDEAIRKVAEFAKIARDMGMISQFSPEGYSRMGANFDFCTDLMIAGAENGITHFNCPDTIGGEDPDSRQKKYYVEDMMKHKAILDREFPGNNFTFSVHNHNDLGNAVQNSFNGIKPGTGIHKVEGTINGVGERAGNADLIQIITRMKTTLSDIYDIDHIDASKIQQVSDLVSSDMLSLQANYPIVGKNAMRHTSGGHTNAIMNNPTAYQPFDPSITGGEISMTYGPNSGGNLAIHIIEQQGYKCPRELKRSLDEHLKATMQSTGRYKGITNEELVQMYLDFISPIKISDYSKQKIAEDLVRVEIDGTIFGEAEVILEGQTVFQALKSYVSENIPGYSVEEHSQSSASKGSDSISISKIHIKNIHSGEEIIGEGRDIDIETSSLKALANAFNTIYINENYKMIDLKI